MKPTLNPVLRDFWRTPARNRVLYGGRASSKSWDAAGFAVFLAQAYRVKFLCTRQFQNKITESVYTLLKIQIERFGLKDQFEILNNVIRHKVTGSEFVFYGLWRHIDEIKSLEGIDICWIEEGHNLTKEQWEILEPTVRKDGSQFWVIFNPRLVTDFVWRRFVRNPPPNSVVRQINYTENPFLSQTMQELIEAAKAEDFEDYQHIYLGVPREDDEATIIKRSWIMAAIDADKRIPGNWRGGKTIGYDVADDGNDKNANTGMDGSVCILLDEWAAGEDELTKSTLRTRDNAQQIGANMIGYDSIGVGASVGSILNQNDWRGHYKFNAGGKVWKPEQRVPNTEVMNKDHFANIKAQAWRSVSNRFKNTFNAVTKGQEFDPDEMISLSSDCDPKLLDQLIDELATPRKDYDNAGKEKVESKKDLEKREISSPNLADSFIIANARGMIAVPRFKEWV